MTNFFTKNNTPFSEPTNQDYFDKNDGQFQSARSDAWDSLTALWDSLITPWDGNFDSGWYNKNSTDWRTKNV